MVGGGRHLRAWRWIFGIAILALAALALSMVIPNQDERDVARKGAGSPTPDIGGAVGTTGADTGDGPAEGTLGTLITELETITGTNDATQLVGRRVDLHVDVQEIANDVAFWVGPPDNRLLVVLARDTRSGVERQAGEPSAHRILPVRAGQQATISGVIRPIPYAEATDSWNLTRQDVEELAARKVYVRAERVSSNGHGGPSPPPSGR